MLARCRRHLRRTTSTAVGLALAVSTALTLAPTAARADVAASDDAPPLTNTEKPTIVGSGWSRETLSVSIGEWSAEPRTVGAVWYSDGVKIANTTVDREVPLADDLIGQWVHVVVTASADCCSSYRERSEPVRISGPRPVDGPDPIGSLEVDSVMTVDEGDWVFPVASYGYQWFRVDRRELVPLATTRRYRVRPADIGSRLAVEVHAVGENGREGTWLGPASNVVRVRPIVRLRTVRDDGDVRGVLRVDLPYPRITVGRHAAVHVTVDDGRVRTYPIRSARTVVSLPLDRRRHTVRVTADGVGQTVRGGRTFTVRRGEVVGAP